MLAVLAYTYWKNMRKKSKTDEDSRPLDPVSTAGGGKTLLFDSDSADARLVLPTHSIPLSSSSAAVAAMGGSASAAAPSSSIRLKNLSSAGLPPSGSVVFDASAEPGDLGASHPYSRHSPTATLSPWYSSSLSPASPTAGAGPSNPLLPFDNVTRSGSFPGDLASVGTMTPASSEVFIRERMPRSTAKRFGAASGMIDGGDSNDSIAILAAENADDHGNGFSPVKAESDNGETDSLTDGDVEVKEKPRLTTWAIYQVYWFLIAIVIVPKQIEEIMGDTDKGKGLSLISLIAGALTLFLAVILGALNDRFASRYGRRRPWMVIGAFMMCASLMLLSGESDLLSYTVGYLVMTISTVVASVPFNGLLADVTPPDQKGAVSAIMGFLNLSGYLCGAIIGTVAGSAGASGAEAHAHSPRFDTSGLYAVMSALVLFSAAVTVLSTRESSSLHLRHTLAPIRWGPFLADMVMPLYTNRDFRLVFVSRFLFQLGIATVQQFLHWIGDCVSTSMPSTQAVSIALVPLLVLSPIGALFIPAKRRKIVIYVSTGFMVTSCLLMQMATTFPLALVVSGVFGLGYGPFISTEFAMLMDVLPSEEGAAKDISLWHSALILPQIVATPIAGWLLDWFQNVGHQKQPPMQCLGYNVVFGLCIVYYLLGVDATRRLKLVK
ncbi:hypothetical protein HDU96_009711 [Phlyctochytrium bullatum]|nr:hypothetical protein HDU96_009711 [Phlyctochytrium bullatum]